MQPRAQVAATTGGSLALEVAKASMEGNVCGVFSAGLAIEVDGLAIMVSADPGGWPLGIGLPSLPTSLSRGWLGLAARFAPTSLDLPDVGCRVDLSQASVWNGGRALRGLNPPASAIAQASRLARSWLGEHPWAGKRGEPSDPAAPHLTPGRQLDAAFKQHIATSLERLTRGLRLGEQTQWSTGLEALLGAGPGLTPAGDDVLTGMLLALQSAGKDSIRGLSEMLTLIPQRAASRTTLYGYSALHAACLGQAPEVVVRALQALFALPAAVPDRLEALVRVGATSGYDTLLGLIAGLELLAHPTPSG